VFSNVNTPFQWRGMTILHSAVVKSVSYFTSKYFDTRFRSIYLPLVSYSKSLKLFFLLLSFSRQMGKIRTCTGFSTKGRAEMDKQVWQVVVKLTLSRLMSSLLNHTCSVFKLLLLLTFCIMFDHLFYSKY
jgi:hypothetical protein